MPACLRARPDYVPCLPVCPVPARPVLRALPRLQRRAAGRGGVVPSAAAGGGRGGRGHVQRAPHLDHLPGRPGHVLGAHAAAGHQALGGADPGSGGGGGKGAGRKGGRGRGGSSGAGGGHADGGAGVRPYRRPPCCVPKGLHRRGGAARQAAGHAGCRQLGAHPRPGRAVEVGAGGRGGGEGGTGRGLPSYRVDRAVAVASNWTRWLVQEAGTAPCFWAVQDMPGLAASSPCKPAPGGGAGGRGGKGRRGSPPFSPPPAVPACGQSRVCLLAQLGSVWLADASTLRVPATAGSFRYWACLPACLVSSRMLQAPLWARPCQAALCAVVPAYARCTSPRLPACASPSSPASPPHTHTHRVPGQVRCARGREQG